MKVWVIVFSVTTFLKRQIIFFIYFQNSKWKKKLSLDAELYSNAISYFLIVHICHPQMVMIKLKRIIVNISHS